MIVYISGRVKTIYKESVVIDNRGIGYQIFVLDVQQFTVEREYLIHIHQQFREDGQFLYGFLHIDELKAFEQLIAIKGVGPKTALNILNKCDYEQLVKAAVEGDIALLSTFPGIGSKSADQIIKSFKGNCINKNVYSTVKRNNNYEDAISALKKLGFSKSDLEKIESELQALNCSSCEEYVKIALVKLNNCKGA